MPISTQALQRAMVKQGASATEKSWQDMVALSRCPGSFMFSPQVELLHYAAILLREQSESRIQRLVERADTSTGLFMCELIWAALYPHLLSAGYTIPRRYAPGPHAADTKTPHAKFEINNPFDASIRDVMAADDDRTGQPVVLKIVCSRRGTDTAHELDVLRFLNEEPRRSHPDNAAVRLLDVLPFPSVAGQSGAADFHIIVMPALRPISRHDCAVEGILLRLMRQAFRMVAFLHSLGICHRDIGPYNFMLAGSQRCPSYNLRLIDFGFSKMYEIQDGVDIEATWVGGQVEPPEVEDNSATVIYEPFRAEIYSLAWTFTSFKIAALPSAAQHLLGRMKTDSPERRPSAAECVQILEHAFDSVSITAMLYPSYMVRIVVRMSVTNRLSMPWRERLGWLFSCAWDYVYAVAFFILLRCWRMSR